MKLLLVSPAFHGYWSSIADSFARRHYEVAVHLYDRAPKAEKVFNKVRYEIPARLRGEQRHLSEEVVTKRAIQALRDTQPDVVLVVRGDVLTSDFWAEVEKVGARTGLWLYDELRRMSYDPEVIESLPALATYSAEDAIQLQSVGIDARYVPLAFDPMRPLRPAQPRGEITFIGARFEKRERFVRSLLEAGLPMRCYGRDWSNHAVDRLRTFRAGSLDVPWARDVDVAEAWAVMRDSLATLNIHGDQDGFTMRTFEACGVGAVQLIDRTDVGDLFESGTEILTFTNEEELLDHAKRAVRYPQELAGVREAGRRRALAEHTFDHRAEALEQLWA